MFNFPRDLKAIIVRQGTNSIQFTAVNGVNSSYSSENAAESRQDLKVSPWYDHDITPDLYQELKLPIWKSVDTISSSTTDPLRNVAEWAFNLQAAT